MVTNNSCDYAPTQYNVQTGGANGTLNNVAPSATSGVPVISQGSSSQPVFGTAVVGGGGTGITTATAYGVLTAGTTSTGNFQVVTPGTSGTVLQSGGASALPTWGSPTGVGSLVRLASQTASNSSSLTFTSGISATYNNYVLMFTNLTAASQSNFELQWSTDGGSSYVATGYTSGVTQVQYNSATWGNSNATTYNMVAFNTGTANNAGSGWVYMFSLTDGNRAKELALSNNNSLAYALSQGYNTTTSVNAFKLLMATGNINTGTFTLYGVLET